MITLQWNGWDYNKIDGRKGFFIVGTKGQEELLNELNEYCKQHPEQRIGYYINPTRPQKGCPVAEYSMEVIINPKFNILWFGFTMIQ
jgi:hypothetical protein